MQEPAETGSCTAEKVSESYFQLVYSADEESQPERCVSTPLERLISICGYGRKP